MTGAYFYIPFFIVTILVLVAVYAIGYRSGARMVLRQWREQIEEYKLIEEMEDL